jgi:hypothetical protein
MGLGVAGYYRWFYFLEGRGRNSNPPIGITDPFIEGLSLKILIQNL